MVIAPGFVTLKLLTPHIQLFGSIENLTDVKYYIYGTNSPATPGVSGPGVSGARTERGQSSGLKPIGSGRRTGRHAHDVLSRRPSRSQVPCSGAAPAFSKI
jgi:hypothetical protein